MINLRYHIISITAVFLALGIGLTLGSTFLDRVTVDHLESQLTDVEHQVKATQAENGQLRDRVSRSQKRSADLAAQLPEQMLGGHLDAVPVLVLATEGTDEDLVASTVRALAGAGAQVAGTWWLTDRWALAKDSDVDALTTILSLSTKDVERLRRNTAIRLSDLLVAASQPTPPATDPAVDPAAPTTTVPQPSEPALVEALVKAGFIDYTPIPGAADHRVLLPGSAARFVVESDTAPTAGAQAFAAALLDELAAEQHVPVVAGQGQVALPDTPSGPVAENTERTTFVGPIRRGELTRTKVTTVDDLDLPAGLAALVLALQDAGEGTVGHYGVATGASRLLPPPAGSS